MWWADPHFALANVILGNPVFSSYESCNHGSLYNIITFPNITFSFFLGRIWKLFFPCISNHHQFSCVTITSIVLRTNKWQTRTVRCLLTTLNESGDSLPLSMLPMYKGSGTPRWVPPIENMNRSNWNVLPFSKTVFKFYSNRSWSHRLC